MKTCLSQPAPDFGLLRLLPLINSGLSVICHTQWKEKADRSAVTGACGKQQ